MARSSKPVREVEHLDPERIAKVALKIANTCGTEGFSLRAVAEELGVTAAALYHHVPDKATIVALMAEAAARERPIGPQKPHWRDDLIQLAFWSRDHALANPSFSTLRRTYSVWGPSAIHMTERWVGNWSRSGLNAINTAIASKTSSFAIIGMVDEEMRAARIQPATVMLPPTKDMVQHSSLLTFAFSQPNNPQQTFELAVEAIIDGLHTRLMKHEEQRPKPATKKRSAKKRR